MLDSPMALNYSRSVPRINTPKLQIAAILVSVLFPKSVE